MWRPWTRGWPPRNRNLHASSTTVICLDLFTLHGRDRAELHRGLPTVAVCTPSSFRTATICLPCIRMRLCCHDRIARIAWELHASDGDARIGANSACRHAHGGFTLVTVDISDGFRASPEKSSSGFRCANSFTCTPCGLVHDSLLGARRGSPQYSVHVHTFVAKRAAPPTGSCALSSMLYTSLKCRIVSSLGPILMSSDRRQSTERARWITSNQCTKGAHSHTQIAFMCFSCAQNRIIPSGHLAVAKQFFQREDTKKPNQAQN